MNEIDIVDLCLEGMKNSRIKAENLLGIELSSYKNASVSIEYLATVEIGYKLKNPDSAITFERQVKSLNRPLQICYYNMHKSIIKKEDLFNKGDPISRKRIDITRTTSIPQEKEDLLIEIKTRFNSELILKDVDKLISVHNYGASKSSNFLKDSLFCVVFYIQSEKSTLSQTIRRRSKRFKDFRDKLSSKLNANYEWEFGYNPSLCYFRDKIVSSQDHEFQLYDELDCSSVSFVPIIVVFRPKGSAIISNLTSLGV